jgi:hypothetical protein
LLFATSFSYQIVKKLDEVENAMKTHLGMVDSLLIIDLIILQKNNKEWENPIYTLQIFVKPNPDTEEIRNKIINETLDGACIL